MSNKFKEFTSAHASEILVITGTIGMGASTILAVRSTPKAILLLEDKRDELNSDKIKPIDMFKTTWRTYLPAAVIFALSATCVVGSIGVNAKRNAAVVAAATLSENALRTYTAKTLEVVGEEKAKEIRQVVAKEKMNDTELSSDKQLVMVGQGEVYCFEGLSGRYFKSDMELIRAAQNNLGHDLLNNTFISLNDYYVELGLDSVSHGDITGWNVDDGKFEFYYDTKLSKDGKPCIYIEPATAPEQSAYSRY